MEAMTHTGENDGAVLPWSDVLDVAVSECVGVILDGTDADWSSKAGRLDWDCRATVLHLASDFVGYAGQLTAPRQSGYVPFDVVLDGDPNAVGLAEVIRATGGVLSSVGRTTSPETLSWHPYGMAGPADFCAMGTVEALVHTHDLSQGLNVTWEPPGWLVGRVLGHLFDLDQAGAGHWSDLLAATGRIPDANQVFVTSWRWHNSGS
jgi:hypothetical protein